jgi:hypothetical protein
MENNDKKCVFIVGPEGSGSKLIAKICSHVMGIHDFGTWNGSGCSENAINKVVHRSLPYGNPPQYPHIDHWISSNRTEYQIYFILTTRDIGISELSRHFKYAKSHQQSKDESERARQIMIEILNSHNNVFIWSYETFMFLKETYLRLLYSFLDVSSDFIPELNDANKNKILYIKEMHYL